ncbi:helix-turn-helix domain-containing protein [Halobacillus sp. ACCC02827]|uniref:helix-turn-helix domain-containing protein n=1 Tax=Halobacillus sp. ACCC02827 TaxID=3052090 RepID=UPI0025700E75|nr:helix-turn-helix domain-containing protein [Halobacillus sp. ACCC02827]WJE17059.1 helix-turn-helix domain-containing protein [Halobacillus sp. ACCC02827]
MMMNWVRKHQTFQSKAELDKHVRSFLYRRKAALSEGTLEVLTFLWRHAVKFPGVTFPKRQTVVKSTGLSESTVVRALRRLVQEGLIEKVRTTKPNGRQGVNLIVFLPQDTGSLPVDDTPPDTLPDTPQKSEKPFHLCSEASFTQPETKEKQRKASLSKSVPLDASYLPSFIPNRFIQTTIPFLQTDKILDAWRTVENAYKQSDLMMPLEAYEDLYIQTFKQGVYAWKKGRIRTELLRYYYGGLVRTFEIQARKEAFQRQESLLYYDWLQVNESV